MPTTRKTLQKQGSTGLPALLARDLQILGNHDPAPSHTPSHTGEFTMKRTATIAALATIVLVASHASAQTNDHFARQRQEAVAKQAALQQHFAHSHGSNANFNYPNRNLGHWGGVTTTHRNYQPSYGSFQQQNIQFYPVSPFGCGVPSYGFYGGGAPYCSPYYGVPGGSGIYIHREIYLSR